jgi:hypothetical protein
MGNADKYRANAEHCLQMASRAFTAEDAQSWLEMAETWFGMIPERQRTPGEKFERAVQTRATVQVSSRARH